MPKRGRCRLAAALVLLALVSGACGGDETPGTGSPTSPGTSSPSPLRTANDEGTIDVSTRGATVDLTIDTVGRAFKPTFVKVAPGQTLRLKLMNPGDTLHTFTITSPDINKQLRTSSSPTNVTVAMPQSGDLAFFCRLHAHEGMWGVFFSGPTPTATPTPY